ncbi:MAG: hypothetical protein ACE5JX_02065 [Acidobacteriota bacterium]
MVDSPRHRHVQAVLGAMRRLHFGELIASRRSRQRDLTLALVASRLLMASSKLATTRWRRLTTLPWELGLGEADENDLDQAMDWLLKRQDRIQKKLAARHLREGGIGAFRPDLQLWAKIAFTSPLPIHPGDSMCTETALTVYCRFRSISSAEMCRKRHCVGGRTFGNIQRDRQGHNS